jgi:hypothetical protein
VQAADSMRDMLEDLGDGLGVTDPCRLMSSSRSGRGSPAPPERKAIPKASPKSKCQ